MNEFHNTRLEKALDEHPLGVKSHFHSSVNHEDLVGIIFRSEQSETSIPYFYEIYDGQRLLAMGGGTNCKQVSQLENLVEERLKAIVKNRKNL